MYLKMIKQFLVSVVLAVGLTVSGCVTTTIGPDGQVQVSEPDYMAIQMLSTATVSAWAASQKDGIKPEDAAALAGIIQSVTEFHKDGAAIDSSAWTAAIAKQVPKRWQGLAIVFVQLTEYQLKKYVVLDQIPTPDSVGGKVMNAISAGALLGLKPYLEPTSTLWEDRTVYTYDI